MKTFLGGLAKTLADALTPVGEDLTVLNRFSVRLLRHGWAIDAVDGNAFATIRTLFGLKPLFDSVFALAAQLESGTGDELDIAEQLIDVLGNIVDSTRRLVNTTRRDLPFPLDQDEFWQEFPRDLVDGAIAGHLELERPGIYALLHLLGLLEVEDVSPGKPGRVRYRRQRLRWDRLATVARGPREVASVVYGWGQGPGQFRHERFLRAVQLISWASDFASRAGPPTASLLDRYYDAGNPDRSTVRELKLPAASTGDVHEETLAEVGLKILPIPETPAEPPTGWALVPYVIGSVAETSDDEVVGSDLLLDLRGNMETDAGVAVEVTPAAVKLGLVATADGELVLSAVPASPWVLIGAEQGHRLELGGVRVRVRVAGSAAAPQFGIELDTTNLPGGRRFALVLDTAEADSFLSRIIGSDPRRVEFSLKLGWSSGRGFEFAAGGTVAFDVPFAVSFPGVQAEGRLAFAIGADQAGLIADATIDVASQLGPLGLAIAGVGARLRLVSVPPDTGGGSFGDVDISLAFKAPGQVGLSILSGPVAGGGFLFFDEPNKRYGGALSLRIYEIEVSAFGIIETMLPDGQPGFSFAILISARFTPIPIGLGFTLNGVGGLLGINRTVDTAALQDSVRTHTLDHVLFPEAPEKNALEILASLRGLFPAAEGRFTFGPMAIIGWGGTIPVLEAEIGLILELPEPIRLTILGQVRAGLPDKDKAFVKLNFDAVGVLDFERKTFSLDASLYESNVGGFPISGDMALRLSWGNPPNFVLSIGGFHPQFQPPPGIPALQRVQVALGQNGNPRITIQGYLAITSNTAQIGARAEVLAFKGSFSVLGWIGFDALFTFQPFTFRVDFSAGVALRKGSRHIASIRLHGTLSGPNPWHASGEACLSVLFFDICIGFSVTLSERKPEALQPAPAIAPRLHDALADLRNWSAELPAAAHQAVNLLVSPEQRPAVLVDPLGGLSVRQRVVPLEFRVTRFENVKLPKNAQPRFSVGTVTLGTGPGSTSASVGRVSDFFARAQFEDVSDAKKLSLPAFEALPSGVSLQSAAVDTRGRVDCDVSYETLVLDAPDAAEQPGSVYVPLGSRLGKLARLSGNGLGGLRAVGSDQFTSRFLVVRTDLSAETFTIASTGGLAPRPELVADLKQRLGIVSKGNAQLALEQHLENNPADRGKLQVVPELELPRAA